MKHYKGTKMVAHEKNAWSAHPSARDIWDLSKRELIEVALHLAARLSTEDYDAALASGDAATIVRAERHILKLNGLV